VAEFIAAPVSTDVWYKLTGTISNLKDGDLYGNFDLTDATGSVYVYGLLSEKGGAKKLFQELVTKYGLTNGSTITIIGNRGEYQGKIEVMNAYISVDGGNGGGNTSSTGTFDNPLTASQAYDLVAAMEKGKTSTEDYYVKGKISSIKYTFSADFGTATFNFSDDGTANGKEFIAYSTYYFGSEQKWVEGNTQVQVGDEVIVCGKVVNYNGNTPEFASKKSYVVKINSQTAASRRK
jgi:RPA family protein